MYSVSDLRIVGFREESREHTQSAGHKIHLGLFQSSHQTVLDFTVIRGCQTMSESLFTPKVQYHRAYLGPEAW